MPSSTVRRLLVLLSAFSFLVFAGACKKKVAPAPPPAPAPAPAPAQPTVTISATSTSLQPGQSTTLNWTSTNATDLDLQPGVGKVAAEGSTNVSPTDTTTYTITATGPGGTATGNVQITVAAPPAPAPAPAPDINALFTQNVKDAYFDYNKSDIRDDARDPLQKDAEFLRSYPQVSVTIEGHCDERGSEEYNLGLGQRRADAAKQYLVSLGISADRIKTMSWGKEHPFCTEHNETCWQQNRRAHFVMLQQQ
ncbi:MAG: peptidoglycan-associated lipoprotein Pal [Candidatus Acidiferrales bacterium]